MKRQVTDCKKENDTGDKGRILGQTGQGNIPFPAQTKWYKYKGNIQEVDSLPRKDETAAGQTDKYAQVTKVHERIDGIVNSAT